MKSTEQVVAQLSRHFDASWAACVATSDPYAFSTPVYRADSVSVAELTAWAQSWHRWSGVQRAGSALKATDGGSIRLDTATRRLSGVEFRDVPERLSVWGLDTAAAVLGDDVVARVRVARDRAARVQAAYPAVLATGLAAELGGLAALTESNFGLLLDALGWLGRRSPSDLAGMAPREIPVAGVHGKWLEQNRWTLASLLGHDLELRWRYPAQFAARYLDPAHQASGRRQHDLFVVGDTVRPLYSPQLVVIVENRRTAWSFPALPGGLVVEGGGHAASELPKLGWLHEVPRRVYWGDLDSDGLEILDRVRRAGLPVTSILTDLPTYERFERFGSFHDVHGEPLPVSRRRSLTALTDAEAELYAHLTDPDHDRTRRIEQERIPLPVALDRVMRLQMTGEV